MGKRKSEQFAWDDRSDRALRACLAGGMLLKTIAARFGTTIENVSERIKELGLEGSIRRKP